MRLIGAGLVCASALWCGLLAAADLRRRAARCAERDRIASSSPLSDR